MHVYSRAPLVSGLDVTSQNLLDKLWQQWSYKLPRNTERLLYLDGKNKLKDLQVAIPPSLVDRLEIVSGWAEKAVTEPANRTVWDGMLNSDGSDDPLGLNQILHENHFKVELPQAIKSSMAYSTAFLSVTHGDVQSGEPEVITMFHSAMYATGLWDRRRRALSAGLLINDVDDLGNPVLATVMFPDETVIIRRGASMWYVDDVRPNVTGRVNLHNMPLAPDLDRPFGRARIDRRVMSLVDRAMRGDARLDVHSELFSAMKLIILGATEDTFKDESGNNVPLWNWSMSRLNGLGRDEEGELPSIEKITAESPEPHIAGLRQLAAEFSGHTGVPLGSLGIATDNPESADAKNVAREDIVFLVENQHNYYGNAMIRAFEDAVMIRDGLSDRPEEVAKIELLWRRPDRATMAALADAGAKQVQAAGLSGTKVGMKMLGMSQAEIRQAEAELRRANVTKMVEALRNDSSGPAPDGPTEPEGAGDEGLASVPGGVEG